MSAQKRKWEHIKAEWRQEKMKIMNALVGPSQNWIDIQKIPEQTVINETFGTRSCLNRIVSIAIKNERKTIEKNTYFIFYSHFRKWPMLVKFMNTMP